MTTTNETTLDESVRQIVDEINPRLDRTENEHALVRYAPSANINEPGTSYDKGAIIKLPRDLPSKRAVIAAVHEANRKRKDADAEDDIAQSAAATTRKVAYTHRVELGRALIEARKLWPTSGPKAKGWGELLESEGLPRQTALDWMKLAGYVPEVPTPRREDLSYRKLGIKKDKKAPSLMERLTSVFADLEGPLNEATDEERKAFVSKFEEWLEAYR